MMASNCIYCFNVRQFGHVLCLLLSVADFIRHPAQMSHQWDMIQQLPQQSLIPMFDGVNVVSNCAWTVNKPVSSSAHVIIMNLWFCYTACWECVLPVQLLLTYFISTEF